MSYAETKALELLVDKIKSKRIALVYSYRDENAPGFAHYDYWDSEVITDWARAIEELQAIPFIIDVRTFGQKALYDTLPPIDFVVNLNAGNYDLSALGLVPSICGFLSIPCIPSDASQTITGENKLLSNLIAEALNIPLPKRLIKQGAEGIRRPLNLGSSIGVVKAIANTSEEQAIYQEFVAGFDMTTPLLFNPQTMKIEFLPSILYVSNPVDVNWFLNADAKSKRQGYEKKLVQIDELTQEMYLSLAKSFGIKTFCRIDSRVKCDKEIELKHLFESSISNHRIRFLEINTMPTITNKINFSMALENGKSNYELSNTYQLYKKLVVNPTPVGFLLACSISSYLQPGTKN